MGDRPDLKEVRFRDANLADLPRLVELLANDPLGAKREKLAEGALAAYEVAFQAIASDPNHRLLVADLSGEVVGMLQLSVLPHLTYEGGWRAQIEGVRVAAGRRSGGLGRRLVETAIDLARERGCHLVQLTTDRRRDEALRFYRRLGFAATHHGLKLHLDRTARQARKTGAD